MPMDYAAAPDYLREYLLYMKTIKERSPRTVDAYYIDLQGFLRYIYAIKTQRAKPDREYLQSIPLTEITLDYVKSVTLADVYQYLNHTLEDGGNNAKTRSRKISSIRSLYKYLTVIAGKLTDNPVKNLESPKLEKRMPKYLLMDECVRLLQAPEGDQAPRDYCMLMLFLNCGMRLSELVGINYSDIRGRQLRLIGKGNKERFVYLNEGCMEAIASYTEDKRRKIAENRLKVKETDKDALFLSSRGTRMSARRVEQIIEELLKKSQLDGKGFSVHKLRHTAATMMYQEGGVDILVLQKILGHSNVGTTEIYTHASDPQIDQAAQKSPFAHFRPSYQSSTGTPEAVQAENISPLAPPFSAPPSPPVPKRRGRPPKKQTQQG